MYVVIHLPGFALQAVLRHELELWRRAVALVDPEQTTPRVVEATPRARAAGVADGLTAPQAIARCAESLIRHRSVRSEGLLTDALVQVVYGFSPHVEVTAAGLITLDARGLAALRGGEGEVAAGGRLGGWLGALRAACEALGVSVRLGVGATPNLARLAACWGGSGEGLPGGAEGVEAVVVPGDAEGREPAAWRVIDAAAFVRSLPVAALNPSSDVAELLGRWGVRSAGELLALGQAELAERIGLEALGLFAAASTTALRPLRLTQPPERFEEAHEWEEPVETLEPVLFHLRRFLDGLGRRLEACGWVAGAVRLALRLESGTAVERVLRVPEPTGRPEVLFRILHTLLEGLRTDSPVRGVSLTVEPARPVQKQFGLFEAAVRDPHQLRETLARLAALLGAENVGSPRRDESHRADAFRLVPPEFDHVPVTSAERVPPWLRPVPMRRLRPAVEAQVRLSAPEGSGTAGGAPDEMRGPERVEGPPSNIVDLLGWVLGKEGAAAPAAARGMPVCAPAGAGVGLPGPSEVPRPVSVDSRMVAGILRRASGPWRASGHWWERGGWRREEWDVEDRRGMVVRLVREGEGWRVEAVLD